MGMSGQPVISARARGADLVMIAGVVNKMNYVLIGAPSVKKPEDLKGKRIGAAQAGTASDHAVLLGLKHWGLDARRDRITILQLGNQGARVASLQSGGSDAIIVNPGLGPRSKRAAFLSSPTLPSCRFLIRNRRSACASVRSRAMPISSSG